MDRGLIDGIVLAGTYRWSGASFERLVPRPLVPVAQAPLISYSLRWIRAGGLPRVFVCVNEATRQLRDRLGDGSSLGVKIDYSEDASPRGAAGCARDVALRSDADSFLICDGTVVPVVDHDRLLSFHRQSGAAMTVVVHRDEQADPTTAPLRPAGVYVAERRVFDFVAEAGFQDIKENLVPRLHREGLPVLTHLAAGCCPRVVDARTYLTVSYWMVQRMISEHGAPEGWAGVYSGTGEVLAHPSAWVDPGAKLLGPMILGPGVRVKAGATIVGPASIGAESTIAEGAVVCRSVTWERCVVGENALLDACVLADDARVEPGADLFAIVVAATAPRQKLSRTPWASSEAVQAALSPWTLRQPASRPRGST
ncbi:MAG: hypothetical protein DMF81_14200 [Acidobacteria bacterium]|nr:MAG: hypothetical protein DMF81_14200 [Acidobacteriota bacterium]